MIDSIYVAMSGLSGHQRGLKVISNNVANMNTTGYKASTLEFGELMHSDAGGAGLPAQEPATGSGLGHGRTLLDLSAGDSRQTGRDLDLMLQGNGMFAGHDEHGALRYSRAGDFEFNTDGVLVNRTNGMKILGRDAEGKVVPLSMAALRRSAPKVSTEVVLNGNLSSGDDSHTIDSVVVYDRLGGAHTLRLDFKSQSATKAGSWLVTVYEGSTEVGHADLQFDGGLPAPGTSPLALQLLLNGTEPMGVDLVLGSDVTSFSSGTTSTLAFKSQDGRSPGEVSTLTFGEDGVLKLTYSNGDSVEGPRLVFAQIGDESGVRAVGDSMFAYDGTEPPVLRDAGSDLKVASQALEMSNVDLTSEFSTLILVQRGYQASSQVLSTANDMLQQLFEMKGRR